MRTTAPDTARVGGASAERAAVVQEKRWAAAGDRVRIMEHFRSGAIRSPMIVSLAPRYDEGDRRTCRTREEVPRLSSDRDARCAGSGAAQLIMYGETVLRCSSIVSVAPKAGNAR